MKKSILNKELCYSFVAIVKFFPRAIVTRQVDGMAFYLPEKQAEFRGRIQSIGPDSVRAWGTMRVAQILHHLNLAVGGVLRFFTLPDESYWLSRTLFKWILVDFFPAQPKGLRILFLSDRCLFTQYHRCMAGQAAKRSPVTELLSHWRVG